MQNEGVSNVLEGVKFRKSIIDKTKAEINERLADSFSVFSYIPFDEVSMSNLIRDLLDIQGSHGQGNLFLLEFIKLIEIQLNIKISAKIDESLYEVQTEVRTSRIENNLRRIDILLSWGQHFAIAIENKPYDKDQPSQLSDYSEHLFKHFHNDFILIYLSDHEPSEKSISNEKKEQLIKSNRYLRIDFNNNLIWWLEESKLKTKSIKIELFLNDLIKKIKERDGMKQELNTEIVNYLGSSDDNLKAAFEITNSMDSVINEIAIHWVENFIKELKNRTGRQFEFENQTKDKKIHLSIKDEQWGQLHCGVFDVGDNSGLFYSLVGDSEFFKYVENDAHLVGYKFWTDKQGNNHKWREHEINKWSYDFSNVVKFKKSISTSCSEVINLIELLDNYSQSIRK